MPGSASLQARTRGKLLHVIARSEATRQSVLSAVGHDRKQYLRQTRKSVYEFARSSASLSSFSAGMRIAAPVCALVRNDMLKEGRVRGGKNVARNDMQKIVALLRVQEGAAGASPQPPTNSPYVLLISTRLCGEADCRVASLLAMTGKNLLRVRTARTHLGRNVVHFTRDWRCASLPGLWMSLRTSAHTGVAIRTLCGSAKRKAALWANPKSATNLP